MKKYIYISLTIIVISLLALLCGQRAKISNLKAENANLVTDNETLLEGVEYYKVQDSLSCAEVGRLQMSLDEYEKYRRDDAKIIRELKAKNRVLSGVSASAVQTTTEFEIVPCDTIIRVDTAYITKKAITIHEKWYDLEGIYDESSFSGKVSMRDSLLLMQTKEYKKFLWWRTRKVKNEKFDLISKNPDTEILGFEHITIEK